MRKTLYEYQKGKQMHASGSWSVTSAERRLINAVAVFFTVSVIAVLVSGFVHRRWFLITSVICCAISFVLMFVVLFGLVFKKSRKEPMEAHYYDVDYRYNGISGETEDETVEISKAEFLHEEFTVKSLAGMHPDRRRHNVDGTLSNRDDDR